MVENNNSKKVRRILIIALPFILSTLLINGCRTTSDSVPALDHPLAFSMGAILNGMNLGNALEAPSPGDWGVTIKPEYFETIHEAGFNSVRIPVRFSAHAGQAPPYIIDPKFFSMVDDVVKQGLEGDLTVILDFHHYDEIMVDPAGQRERFKAIWKQLAEHYQDSPPALYFELLNEPNQRLDAETWNTLVKDTIKLVRTSNPRRKILVGGINFNSIESFAELRLPSDKNLIVTFHFYQPFEFTHQGAEWIAGSANWIGTTWNGTPEEKKAINDQLDLAAAWSAKNGVPLIMGEFGSIVSANEDSRQRWTKFVARETERRNIGWIYWEFCSEFRVYDCQLNAWDAKLINALFEK